MKIHESIFTLNDILSTGIVLPGLPRFIVPARGRRSGLLRKRASSTWAKSDI
jgi:hypothetical protein